MAYGTRWYGSRSYGDGATAGASTIVTSSGSSAITFTLTDTIVVTGRTEVAPWGEVTFALTNSVTVTGKQSVTSDITFALVNNVFAVVHGVDGFGSGFVNPLSEQKILWAYDLHDVQTMAITEFLGFEYEIRLQEREVLRWSLLSDDPKNNYLDLEQTVRWDNRRFIITLVTPTREGAETYIYYEAEARWIELGDTIHTGEFSMGPIGVDGGIATLLIGTQWTYQPTGDTTVHSVAGTDASALALLRSWALVSEKELNFDTENRVLTLVDQQGNAKSRGFRYGRDLVNMKKKEERVLATRLYLTGNAELTLASPGYIEDFSYYTGRGLTLLEAQTQFTRVMTKNLTSITTQTDLNTVAANLLAIMSVPQISYEMEVKEMTIQSGYDFNDVGIGDSVPVWDPILGDSLIYPRVVRLVRKPWEPWNSVVELSTLKPDLTNAGLTAEASGGESEWVLLKHDSPIPLAIVTFVQNVNFIEVEFLNGEAVFGYEMDGVANGAGTITIDFYDALTGLTLGPSIQRLFTAGVFHEVGSFALKELNG